MGFRPRNTLLVRPGPALPTVTLYNQSPNPAVNFYRALLPTNYIVNGEQAVAHEFPWMAALMNLQRQFCGGSLIDENHILTAAHCVAHMSKYDDSQTVVKHVKRVIRHKGFSSSTLWNDVAILTLDSAVQYSDTIQPICLAQGSQTYVNNIVT